MTWCSGGLMGGFSPTPSLFAAAALNRPQFPDGLFPCRVAQRRTPAVTPGGSQPARLPRAWAHCRRRPDGGLSSSCNLSDRCRPRFGSFSARIAFTGTRPRSAFLLAAFGILHSLACAMITGPVAARLGERRSTHARNDCRRHRLHPACLRDTGDGWRSPIMVLLASGWHRNAGAASNVVQAGG